MSPRDVTRLMYELNKPLVINSRDIAEAFFNGRELNNDSDVDSDTSVDMDDSSSLSSLTTTSLSLSSHATASSSLSSFEDGLSAEDKSVLPDESFDEDPGTFEKEKEDKDEENFGASANSANDMPHFVLEYRKVKCSVHNERHNEEEESIFLVSSSVLESTVTCSARGKQAEDLSEDQRDQSVKEIRVEERCECNMGCIYDETSRDSTVDDARACENDTLATRFDAYEKKYRAGTRAGRNIGWLDLFHDATRLREVHRIIAESQALKGKILHWKVVCDDQMTAADIRLISEPSLLPAKECDPGVRSPRLIEMAFHNLVEQGGPDKALDFLDYLVIYGCPLDVQDIRKGWTALHMLCHQLISNPLFNYFFDAALNTLELLAKTGAVNAQNHQGETALHILASAWLFDQYHKANMESLITTLLAAGADTKMKNQHGQTALHLSLECGALNAASLLIEHTPTNILTPYAETPLNIALRYNQVDMVAKLLQHGADPRVSDFWRNTPLQHAYYVDVIEVSRMADTKAGGTAPMKGFFYGTHCTLRRNMRFSESSPSLRIQS